MRTIRVTAMLALGLAAVGALAQEAGPPEKAPGAKPAPSTPSTESTSSTDPKPGEARTFAGIVFVWIPAGSFIMGSPENEEGRSRWEDPQHKVTFAEGFWMGQCEVTQAEWQAVMGDNPSKFKASDRRPVEQVSWNDCQAFVQKLNGKGEGTFRLPSEAEWEYACRAGTTTPFHFGETISTYQANYCGHDTYGDGPKGVFRAKTTEVGNFPPNDWGLYDMHGNVWEWCQDRYYYSYDGAPTDGRAWESPASRHRVLRGGSWFMRPSYCRAACRFDCEPDYRGHYSLGLRLVRTL